jgi:hypothetical protein
MFEQGAGIFSFSQAFEKIKKHENKLSVFPNVIKLTTGDSYTYPYSLQPLYISQMPMVLNLTLMNSYSNKSYISGFEWQSASSLKNVIDVKHIIIY